jgi:hypothetical protein
LGLLHGPHYLRALAYLDFRTRDEESLMSIEERIMQILDAMAYFGGLLCFISITAVLIWGILIHFFQEDGDGTYDE